MLGAVPSLGLTGELRIRGAFCDLAVRQDDRVCQLIEVKTVGLTLTERHLRQAMSRRDWQPEGSVRSAESRYLAALLGGVILGMTVVVASLYTALQRPFVSW